MRSSSNRCVFGMLAVCLLSACSTRHQVHRQQHEEPSYVDAGSLGTVTWSPSTGAISNALTAAREFTWRYLSDQSQATDTEIHIDVSFSKQAVPSNREESPTTFRDEGFTIKGIAYADYLLQPRPFLQKYGSEEIRYIAIQHIPSSQSGSGSATPMPFTLYFNVKTGHIGQRLNLPVILYSPGPPYSFHRKGVY